MPCQVKWIKPKECVIDYLGNCVPMSYNDPDLLPIPLTPELLINNCGFKEDSNCCFWHSRNEGAIFFTTDLEWHNFAIKFKEGKFCKYYDVENDEYSYDGFEIKYVHQLQNLYFALIGSELTVTL